MLRNIHVKNLALIEELDVDFQNGLNILTGETGAGKSIIVDSMMLGLGGKFDKNLVRNADSPLLVELTFDVDNALRERLTEYGVLFEDSSFVISRRITGGKNLVRINGETFSVSFLKEIGSKLIDIYGQNEHHSLVNNDRQLGMVDDFGGEDIKTTKNRVSELYSDYREALHQYEELSLDNNELARQTDLLSFEINEIKSASLMPGEDDELEARFKFLSNAQKIIEGIGEAYKCTGYDKGAGDLVGNAIRFLNTISEYDEKIASMSSSLDEIDNLLNDFNREIADYSEEFTFDDEEYNQVSIRLDEINRLKRKYGYSIESILSELEHKEEQLQRLLNFEENIEKAKRKVKNTKNELEEACTKLSLLREKAAKDFSNEVIAELEGLNFNQSLFEVEITKKDSISSNGWDTVEFMISTNPGEPVKPLKNTASGGELSRVMLGIKSVFAAQGDIDTMIFDEIDTGISGRTAQKVAEKLVKISSGKQLICITHLPQIASMADCHLKIEKSYDEFGTRTNICVLSENESIDELARMIGGAEITEQTLSTAREMKKISKNNMN